MISEDRKILAISTSYFIATFLVSLVRPLRSDSTRHIIRSRYILENGSFPFLDYSFNMSFAYVYPPLFHILGAISKFTFGFYTVVPAFMGAFSVFLSYKLVKIWYNEETAFLSALGLVFLPFFFIWSTRMYIGTTITAGFLLTFYLYFRYTESGKRKFLYTSFVIGGLMAALKTYGPLASVIVFIHFFWMNRENIYCSFRKLVLPVVAGALVSLPWPIRNFILTGSPVPKLTGGPLDVNLAPFQPEGIFVFIPLPRVVLSQLIHVVGIVGGSMVWYLGEIHPLLLVAWFSIPLTILGLAIYGATFERDNSFIWIWLILLLCVYEIGRIMSHGTFSFKIRHFITFTPMLALFLARSYQNFPLDFEVGDLSSKKLGFALLILLLTVQMAVGIFVYTKAAENSLDPIIDWTQKNIPGDEVIYTAGQHHSPIAYKASDYTVITDSPKEGYINPDKDFGTQLLEKADWVLLTNHSNNRELLSRLRDLEQEGLIKHVETLDTRQKEIFGEVGRFWEVYRISNGEGPAPYKRNLENE